MTATFTLTCSLQTELTSLQTLTLELNRASGVPTDIGFQGARNGNFVVPTADKLPALDLTYDTSGNSKHWVANGGANGSRGSLTIAHNGSEGNLNITFVPEQVSGNTAKGNLHVQGTWKCAG